MKILVVYATTEGQTRKVARHVFDRLAGAGHSVELLPAGTRAGSIPAATTPRWWRGPSMRGGTRRSSSPG